MKNVICPSVKAKTRGSASCILRLPWSPRKSFRFRQQFRPTKTPADTHTHTHIASWKTKWVLEKKEETCVFFCRVFLLLFSYPEIPHPLNGLDCWIQPSLAPRANGLLRVSWRSIPPTWKYIEKGEEDEWKRKTSGPGFVERRKDTAKQFPFRRRWFQLPKKVLKNILFIFFC